MWNCRQKIHSRETFLLLTSSDTADDDMTALPGLAAVHVEVAAEGSDSMATSSFYM